MMIRYTGILILTIIVAGVLLAGGILLPSREGPHR